MVEQVSLIDLGLGLDEELDEQIIRRYIYDITCMRFQEVHDMSRDQQSELLYCILCATNNDEGNTSVSSSTPQTKLNRLASVHFRLWPLERFLELLFTVLSIVPYAQSPIYDYLTRTNRDSQFNNLQDQYEFTPALDSDTQAKLLKWILEGLYPWNQGWTNEIPTENSKSTNSLYRRYVRKVEQSGPTINALLDFLPESHSQKISLAETQSKLTMYSMLILAIIAPLSIHTEKAEQLFQSLHPQDLLSSSMLKQLIVV
jgi:hypothetical protein